MSAAATAHTDQAQAAAEHARRVADGMRGGSTVVSTTPTRWLLDASLRALVEVSQTRRGDQERLCDHVAQPASPTVTFVDLAVSRWSCGACFLDEVLAARGTPAARRCARCGSVSPLAADVTDVLTVIGATVFSAACCPGCLAPVTCDGAR